MYIGHTHLCVCLSVHSCTTNGGVPLVLHCWADFQSVHGFHYYGNSAKCEMSASVCKVALCLVDHVISLCNMW